MLSVSHRNHLWPFFFFFFGTLTENRSVKAGNWVEFQDFDGYPTSEDGRFNGTALQRFYDEVCDGFERAGYEVHPGPKLEQWLKEAGFVNIHVERFRRSLRRLAKGTPFCKFLLDSKQLPNNNPVLTFLQKKIGAWNRTQAEAVGYESLAIPALTQFKQGTEEKAIRLSREAFADGQKHNIHMLFNL